MLLSEMEISNAQRRDMVGRKMKMTGKLSGWACACTAIALSVGFSNAVYAQATVTPEQVQQDVNDPFEGVNRVFFGLNEVVDDILLRPAAIVYRTIIPRYGRQRIRNVLNNLDSPVVFANDILQGEGDRAGDTLMRFLINSTFGVAGIWDVATDWGHPFHDEDFGQTLAVWGVNEGPYLYFPLLGPSNPRDSVGRVVDIAFDPLTYVNWGDDYENVPLIRTAVNVIDLRSRNIETLDEIERSSVDYYASIRSLYRQVRNDAIRNGEQGGELPEFDNSGVPGS
jgi:phospholipid-binding lipoprotein MlaA